jgi:hypothetical protein
MSTGAIGGLSTGMQPMEADKPSKKQKSEKKAQDSLLHKLPEEMIGHIANLLEARDVQAICCTANNLSKTAGMNREIASKVLQRYGFNLDAIPEDLKKQMKTELRELNLSTVYRQPALKISGKDTVRLLEYFPFVRTLNLLSIDPDTIQQLHAKHFENITTLALPDNSNAVFDHLAKQKLHIRNLSILHAGRASSSASLQAFLVSCEHLEAIDRLHTNTYSGQNGNILFTSIGVNGKLKKFNAVDCDMAERDLQEVASNNPHLQCLHVRMEIVSEHAMRALGENCRELRTLEFVEDYTHGSSITEAALEQLGSIETLQKLALPTSVDVRTLAKVLPKLRRLETLYAPIDDACAEAIATAQLLLKELLIDSSSITEKGIKILAEAKIPMRTLGFIGCDQVTEASLASLESFPLTRFVCICPKVDLKEGSKLFDLEEKTMNEIVYSKRLDPSQGIADQFRQAILEGFV